MKVGTKCMECQQTHPVKGRHIYNDPDNHVASELRNHRGLPFDCPRCLTHGSIERRQYGKGGDKWALTCAFCKQEFFWIEGKDGIPSDPQ